MKYHIQVLQYEIAKRGGKIPLDAFIQETITRLFYAISEKLVKVEKNSSGELELISTNRECSFENFYLSDIEEDDNSDY